MATDAGFEVESSLFAAGAVVVAGVDDVGYGAICGPIVFGAIAVRPSTPLLPGLRDSKLLSAARRERLAAQIPGWAAAHALGVVHAVEIDEIGVKAALRTAVRGALTGLETGLGQTPDRVILDGSVNLV
jgi:ribonuclease HII